jgi:CubicO group peptidase (beta-lactamase class C family)
VEETTQFMLASLSKSFTAVAVLQLARTGRIDLDAPVRDYLSEFTTSDPDASGRITVRHLLHHTSGLADAGFRAGLSAKSGSLAQRVRDLQTASLVSEPGQQFHYFEPNYQLLARLVEVVTGEPFEHYLAHRVFRPVGLTGTVAADTTAEARRSAPRLAKGHVVVFGVPVARQELDGLLTGSSGVVSTAQDIARWLVLHLTEGRVRGSLTGLQQDDFHLMHTPQLESAALTGRAGSWSLPATDLAGSNTPAYCPRSPPTRCCCPTAGTGSPCCTTATPRSPTPLD